MFLANCSGYRGLTRTIAAGEEFSPYYVGNRNLAEQRRQ